MEKKLRLSATDRKISGLCGGLGEYFNIDPTVIRILWVLLAICTCSFGFWAYLICWLIVPPAQNE